MPDLEAPEAVESLEDRIEAAGEAADSGDAFDSMEPYPEKEEASTETEEAEEAPGSEEATGASPEVDWEPALKEFSAQGLTPEKIKMAVQTAAQLYDPQNIEALRQRANELVEQRYAERVAKVASDPEALVKLRDSATKALEELGYRSGDDEDLTDEQRTINKLTSEIAHLKQAMLGVGKRVEGQQSAMAHQQANEEVSDAYGQFVDAYGITDPRVLSNIASTIKREVEYLRKVNPGAVNGRTAWGIAQREYDALAPLLGAPVPPDNITSRGSGVAPAEVDYSKKPMKSRLEAAAAAADAGDF